MNSKLKYLLKNVGLLTISNFASKILIFLLVPIYTNILSTTEYGNYDLAISTVQLLYPLLSLNIIDAVMRFSMDDKLDKYTIAGYGIKFTSLSIIFATIFVVIFSKLELFYPFNGLELYIITYYIFYALNQYFIQLSKGLEHVVDMALAGVLSAVTLIVSNLVFLLLFNWRLNGFFLASILSQAVPVIYFFFKMKFWEYISKSKTNKALVKEMLYYCIPLVASTIGWWVNCSSDKYVVTFICGVAANGLLSVAYKIPSILNILQSIFIQAWQISAIKEYGENDIDKFYGSTFSTINVLMCAACSWLILLTRPIAHFMYAKDFYKAWAFVPFILVSSVLNCASGVLGPILSAKKNSKAMMWSALIGAGTNIMLNIILVCCIGVQGATIATAISSFIIYEVRKIAVGKDIKIEKYWTVLFTWGMLCIQSIVEIYIKSYVIEGILMIIMLVVNKSTLRNIILIGRKIIRR